MKTERAPTTPTRVYKRTSGGDRESIETAPTGRSTCRTCNRKIPLGQCRVKVAEYNVKYRKDFHKYFHINCAPLPVKQRLQAAGKSPEKEKTRRNNQAAHDSRILYERRGLTASLRELRKVFGRRMGYSDKLYMIFDNRALHGLVLRLPVNEPQFLAVPYMGTKKYDSFGGPIIEVIKSFKFHSVANRGGTGDDDHFVEAVESLSCEEIVNRKFEHARENGYFVEV